MSSINCKGKLIDLSTPKVMGILNVTPDSFFDGGKYKNEHDIINQVERMLSEGATFIDIGAYSSRPGAKHVSEEEELTRIVPIVQLLIEQFPKIILSIDTFRSEVAKKCISLGASIINDISAGNMDDRMFKAIAELQVPYIFMHMQGTPATMQNSPTYENATRDVLYFLSKKIVELRKLGVNDLIADVGFGFGKTIEHNFELLNHLELFGNLEIPLLVGLSRKSMLYKPLNITPEKALNATNSANTIALMKGASILRVHDVMEAVEAIKILELVKKS